MVLILRALRSLSSRREVVVPAYTCFAVVAAVREAGLVIRPSDIEPSTLGLDPTSLKAVLTEDTLCVIATHHFGVPSNVGAVRDQIADRVPFVVENASQAMGCTFGGRPLGTLGDVGLFSFGRGKAITAGGGGAVLTSHPEIGPALEEQYATVQDSSATESWRDYVTALLTWTFIRPWLYWLPAGLPFSGLGATVLPASVSVTRLSRMSRALLREWKFCLDEGNEARQRNAEYFTREIGLPWGSGGSAFPLRLPVLVDRSDVRDRILSLSARRGLGIVEMYPYPIDRLPGVTARPEGYPCAEHVAKFLVTIPTHHFLNVRDRARIVAVFREAGFPSPALAATLPI